MTKLTYTNDQQIINDAAQMLVESHLRWTDSGRTMPSEDRDCVRSQMLDAYLEAHFDIEEWLGMTDVERTFHKEIAASLFKQAARIADRKWQAAMTLLGIED